MSRHRTDETERTDNAATEHWSDEGAPESSQRRTGVEPPHLPETGQIIGAKYRIEDKLGKGGMGAVFRATHVVSGKSVALKWMLRPTSDQRALSRFTREARAAGRIDHPNVVDVYDIGHDGDASYLVMELLHGESLRQRMAAGMISLCEVIDLLLPAMRGVAAAHRQGVIHRDLKPDNIFLCRGPEGEPRQAKVLDFGISTFTAADSDAQTKLTTEGSVLGTPSYMAPEQIEHASEADARVDVYAFGVILYEALTGRLPFTADNYFGLVLAIAKAEPIEPRELRADIPDELQRVILCALHKDPKRRAQSMESLIELLSPFASATQADSGTPNHWSVERPRLPRPARKSMQLAWISLVVLAFACLGWFWLRARSSVVAPVHSPALPRVVVQTELSPARQPAPEPPKSVAVDAPAPPPVPAQPSPAQPAPTRQRRATKRPVPSELEPPPPSAAAPSTPRAGPIRVDEL